MNPPYQMSGGQAPSLAPQPQAPPSGPSVVHGPEPEKPRSYGWILLVLLIVGGLAYWFWPRPAAQQAAERGASTVRTVAAGKGDVLKTLRLTGTTGAERFASLLVPQLRGSRSESLREGRTFQGPGSNFSVQSNAGRSGPSVGTGTSVASTAGQSGGGSSAQRAATSRVQTGARSSGSSGGNITQGSAGSSGGDLGSTAGSLIGGGGGSGGGGGFRGGGGDYALVLQDAAKPGTVAKKGQVVAEFDRQYMLQRLEDYRASVAQMEASFEKLKAEVEVQRKMRVLNIDNQKAALDKARLDVKTAPVLGTIDAERVKLALEEAEARYKQLLAELKLYDASYKSQIRNAELELRETQVEYKRSEANTDRMLMKAPIDGLVVMQTTLRGTELAQIQVGDQLYPGMRFMQIVDTSSMVVNAVVNQVDAESMRVGAKAMVRFDAFPGLELPAHVHAIGAMTRPGGMRAAFVKDIPVVLKLDKLDPRVIPDLSVSVDVELEREQQAAAVVPLGSVFREPGRAGEPFVFVKNGEVWDRRPVQLGLSNHLVVAVRSGVKPGEVVAAEYPPVVQNKD